jgi:hypothetical protein
MRLLSKLKPRLKGLHRLASLSPEVPGLIFEHLRCDGPHNLINICLVSRGLYLFSIPYLYLHTKLDLGRASHSRLLQRLAGPECRLAEKIRTITITDTEKFHMIRWESLYILFTRLKHLREFDWNGPLGMPYFLLEVLASRHPQARLNIVILKPMPKRTSNATRLSGHVLAHRVGLQINQFIYRYDGTRRLSVSFKKSLLTFLTKKDTLSVLAIFNEDPEDTNTLPETLEYFRNSSFPCMQKLVLHTTMFTSRELSMWASRGKWDRLILLHVHNIHLLRMYSCVHIRTSC